MKQFIFPVLLSAASALTVVPYGAQAQKKEKETQTIVITRTGDIDEKTVVEIKGDKVTVNGKDGKAGNVRVNVHTYQGEAPEAPGRPGTPPRPPRPPRPGRDAWSFNGPEGSFFSEDSSRAMLGVITDRAEKGALVSSVSRESAAEKAGLKKGDVITRIDEDKIEDPEDVARAVRSRKPGDKVTITVLRDGKEQRLSAQLDRWKGVRIGNINLPRIEIDDFDIHMSRPNISFGGPRLGLSVQDTEEGKGVKVTDVEEESNAAKAGLREDDLITHINDKPVSSADEVSRAVREGRDKGPIRFGIQRGGKAQTIEVRYPRRLKTADL